MKNTLPIASIQEKHEWMYEWLRKEKGGKAEERRQEKGKEKNKKEDNWIEGTALSPYKFFF